MKFFIRRIIRGNIAPVFFIRKMAVSLRKRINRYVRIIMRKGEQTLEELFQEKGLSKFWKPLKKHIKNGIYFSLKRVKEDAIAVGQSKVGGLPDLPEDVEWFTFQGRSMLFLSQINLEEVKSFDLEQKLPASGILYFFYDPKHPWGFDPADKGSSQVFFYQGKPEHLKRRQAPPDLYEYTTDSDEFTAVFKSCRLRFRAAADVPHWESDLVTKVEGIDIGCEEDWDNYYEMMEEMKREGEVRVNKLLGHSDNVQSGMEHRCESVTNGIYCGEPTDDPKILAREKELEKNIDTWTLLFQLDSNYDEADMMWDDGGRVYFWIKKEDLANENFENGWTILQSH